MPLPSNVGTGTVTGNFSEDAIAGVTLTSWKVTLTPSVRQFADVTATPASIAFLKPSYEGTLDSSGNLSMEVPATDDTSLNPLDFTYRVTYTFPGLGLNPTSFFIEVPEGATVDLPTVNPVQQSNGAVIVEGVPTGGTAGQVLAKASGTSYDTEWVDQTGGGGGATTLGGLTDVTTTGVTSGQVLKYNGTEWAPGTDNTGGGGGSVAWADITGKPAVIGAGTDAAAARTAIGAGTSSLALGTTSSTAKAGDYEPAWADVSGKPAVIAAGADAATARSAIGAGTSNLAIGTTSTTAMAGDKTAADLGGMVSDPTGITGATAFVNIVKISEADYAALPTKDPAVLYVRTV
jgi:hypothetical protein